MRFVFASNDFRGYQGVLAAAGHETRVWSMLEQPVFDLFSMDWFDVLFIKALELIRTAWTSPSEPFLSFVMTM